MNNLKYLLGFIVGFIITSAFILFSLYFYFNDKIALEIAKIVFSAGILFSVFIAIFQLRLNFIKNNEDKEWNKRYLAFTKMTDYVKELEELRTQIDEVVVKKQLIKNDNGKPISFTDRKRIKDKPITFKEVHKWVCKHTTDGERVQIESENNMCCMTEEGAIITRCLISIINTYEAIAIGVAEEILSKKIIEEGLKNLIINNYIFLEDYIKHRREKHGDIDFGSSWENLYKTFKDEN